MSEKNGIINKFEDFLTEIDVSHCERLDGKKFNLPDFQDGYSEGVASGMNIMERFKKECEKIDLGQEKLPPDYQAHLDWYKEQDQDQEWIDSINERLF